jgi:NTE family protein
MSLDEQKSRSVGLALGGGGARGLAHILALEAFDEVGLKPEVIAGTSIGAIFGAAYALGLSGSDIRKRAIDLLSNPATIARKLFASGTASWSDIWSFRPFTAALIDPQALVEIIFPEATGKTFADLEIPLRIAATNYRKQTSMVLEEGALAPAIAASMALPALFRPVDIAGDILVDGGMTDPLPYDLLSPE